MCVFAVLVMQWCGEIIDRVVFCLWQEVVCVHSVLRRLFSKLAASQGQDSDLSESATILLQRSAGRNVLLYRARVICFAEAKVPQGG